MLHVQLSLSDIYMEWKLKALKDMHILCNVHIGNIMQYAPFYQP